MKNLTERVPKDLLKWTAAGFALVATATAEYEIARAIGMNEWIAAAVPGALDAYVVRALRTHREVLTSVVAMVGVNAASHLVTAGILPVEWPLITAVSAIAPLVLWRVHALGTPGEARRRVLWGRPWRARPAEHTSTEPEHTEHGRAPDNPEPPGTREHPEHKANAMGLDVPDWVNPPSTPPVPVHAPYADHVHIPSTPALRLVKDTSTELDPTNGFEHTMCTTSRCVLGPDAACPQVEHTSTEPEHTPSTRTADDWNLEHVSTGTLTPYDTAHMARARELFHTLGRVPSFRALKHGDTPGMGTDRAKRIRAALTIESKGTD